MRVGDPGRGWLTGRKGPLGDMDGTTARRHPPLPATLAAVTGVLAAFQAGTHFGPEGTGLVAAPAAALVLVGLGRWAGLSWEDLGLARRAWRRGMAWAGGAAAVVAAVYGAGVALPATRHLFLDVRFRLPLDSALLTALVVIPLRTVVFEEVAFRGVLHGLVRRRRGTLWASGVSSALFGLWHVLPSLHLGSVNQGVERAFGAGAGGRVLTVLAVVAFTFLAGLVFCELRRRSGSLLAPAGLHWAVNGLAVIVAALVWQSPPG